MSADAVAAAVTLTNDCIKDGNAVEATSKAAASAWRSSQVSNDASCCLSIQNCQEAWSAMNWPYPKLQPMRPSSKHRLAERFLPSIALSFGC